jgi:hypothetical protein
MDHTNKWEKIIIKGRRRRQEVMKGKGERGGSKKRGEERKRQE